MRISDRHGQFTEVPSQHLGRGIGIQAGQLAAANIELIERKEPESFVSTVIDLGEQDRTAQGKAPLVLDAQRLRGGEKAARVKVLVIVEVKPGTVQLVRSRFHGETGDSR